MMTNYFIILFFGISPGELFIILLVVLILFGPRKIPEIAKTLGRGYSELKKAQRELNSEIQNYKGDLEKETNEFQKEVKSVIDDSTENKESKNTVDTSEDISREENNQPGEGNKQTDNDDDLPYPYNRNKNLKA